VAATSPAGAVGERAAGEKAGVVTDPEAGTTSRKAERFGNKTGKSSDRSAGRNASRSDSRSDSRSGRSGSKNGSRSDGSAGRNASRIASRIAEEIQTAPLKLTGAIPLPRRRAGRRPGLC
jgi:hypothetical protein